MGHAFKLHLYKAVVSAPLSVKGFYIAAGAAVGTVEGLLLLTEQECAAVLQQLEQCLHDTQERYLEHCGELTTKAYRVAGACAGERAAQNCSAPLKSSSLAQPGV